MTGFTLRAIDDANKKNQRDNNRVSTHGRQKDEDAEDKDATEEGGEEGVEGAEDSGKSNKKRKIIIIAAIAVVLLGGIGAGLYFSGIIAGPAKVEPIGKKIKKKKSDEPERGTTGSSVKSVKQNLNEWVPGVIPGHEGDDVVYYNLPEFLVNLNTGGKQTSFIKMKVTLEAPSDSDADAIDSRMPRITDSFNTYLRELRTSDLSGSAGLYRLREELLLRVNKTIYPSKVNDILFREIILQ